MLDVIQERFAALEQRSDDLYVGLNHFRDWFNATIQNYELYLEDEWYDDKTVIEYTLRSLDTFNILVFAQDEYHNHRDEKGVWHLDDYMRTVFCISEPWTAIQEFFAQNGPPTAKSAK